ncbi:hypothetical protein [Henriciella mobilis]|uniref:Uncharacterized protein n=1 Tax=Henriciella mobilis TaxID=2305467 RepID=A0A399RFH8_9PROT|nr:hypothetical protein [Henriciella mobilis]RIJ30316.1 hypothetical protein D1223_06655 [Henriciella mobilis]
MSCETGPLERQFGNTDWIVYSCQDEVSLVIISAEGNPAMPFYFMFFPKDGKYRLHGEGNGDKTYTEAAFEELKQLGSADIQQLIVSTKQAALSAEE